MKKDIQFGVFSSYDARVEFCQFATKQLLFLPEMMRNNIKLVIFTTPELESRWLACIDLFIAAGIEVEITTKYITYLDRTYYFVNNSSTYSCRLDDDIFISSHLFEFMFSNLHLLDDPTVYMLSPLFSTGIPSVDLFIEDLEDENLKRDIYKMFIKSSVPTRLGYDYSDYSALRDFIFKMPDWDYMEYYTQVNKLDTICKGIHPIRVDNDSNLCLMNYIISHLDKVMEPQPYNFTQVNGIHNTHPFLCKTESWKLSLKVRYDDFDELSTNSYILKNDLSTYFIRNGFAIHMAHGYVNIRKEIETQITRAILNYKKQ